MTKKNNIIEQLKSKQIKLQSNTVILDNSDSLQIDEIENGIIIVYASWSGPALSNCTETMQMLYDNNYKGVIILIDTDVISAEIQEKVFGNNLNGWGEIVEIKAGKVFKKHLGKACLDSFKTAYILNK
jgi:hypothetical protein